MRTNMFLIEDANLKSKKKYYFIKDIYHTTENRKKNTDTA